MWERTAWAAVLCFSLGACQQPRDDTPFITGGGPVTVLSSQYVTSGDSSPALASGAATYVITRVELTNDLTVPLYPTISHFSLTDRSGSRYFGIDTGTSTLAGISNDLRAIKPGEKRTLVVAFRADATTMGMIRYDY